MQALIDPKTENKKFLFLLIGPWDKRFEDLGALIYRDIDRALLDLDHISFYVLALSVTNLLSRSFPSFYEALQRKQNKVKTILLLPKDFDLQKSISLLQKYPFHGIIESQNDPEVETVLMSTLELARTEEQKDMFTKLASDESESLKKFSEELELRVEKRTKFLTEARRKSFLSNLKNEAFKKVLTFIHEATDAEGLETRLNNVLLNVVEVAWIKICTVKEEIEFEDKLKKEFNYQYLKIPLYEDDAKSIGSLFFMRQENLKFSKEDREFLDKIAEFVALALGKIKKLQELGAAKEIWQSTFQAISEPILLIDENYTVLQSNLNSNLSTFSKNQTHSTFKCYQILFSRTEPCPNCHRGKKFELNFDKNYEVFSQSLKFDHENQSVFVNFYHDITERKIFETQLIERAKLAELGTIGSSIAHELNNPLGGMLSFTQLIKTELNDDHLYYNDILEIEKGILRSKNIVQNLLNFSRRSDLEDSMTVSLSEAFERAISILALKTKQLNLSFNILLPPDEDQVMGSTNLLAQAFKNILILVIDRIEKEITLSNSNANSKWVISIQNKVENVGSEKKFRKVLIHIDNTYSPLSNKALNLEQIQPDQLTLRILSDHQIQISPTPIGPQLTFLRPVFRSRKP